MEPKGLKILIINPGSTSTKIAVYKDETPLFSENLKHSTADLAKFGSLWDQYDFRKKAIINAVAASGFSLNDFVAVVSRGGTVKPILGGTYLINASLAADAKSGLYGSHACNVGCQIAFDLGRQYGIDALTVDPPACDELSPEARYSGIPLIERRSSYHALNQKAIARKLARDLNKKYAELQAIVVHLGGGISVGAHCLGKVIDVNNALDGDGPFSPERSGALPVGDLIRMCYSQQYTRDEMLGFINGKGGLVAYLQTTDGLDIEERIRSGDRKAQETIQAMAYQVAKEIGAAAAVLKGRAEAIALTGGLANWKRLVELIAERVAFIAPLYLYPGENEMESLALGALRYLRGEETVQVYC